MLGAIYRHPDVGRLGRPKRLRENAAAGPRAPAGRAEHGDVVTGDLQRGLDEPLQHRLRVAVDEFAVAIVAVADLAPGLVVEILVEAGQHHGAVRQPRDRGKERCGRRHRARRPCGDDGRLRALAPKPFRLRLDQGAAPMRRVARAALGEDPRPALDGDAHEVKRELEVLGILALDGLRDLVPGNLLDRKRIHEELEIGREVHGVGGRRRHQERHPGRQSVKVGADGRRPTLDQPRQNEPPLHRRDRRCQGGGRFEGGFEGARGEVELRLIGVAERDDARQELRPAAVARRDDGGEGPRRPAGRQIDHGIGCGGVDRCVATEPAVEQRVGERRQEWNAGGNREDAARG